MDPTLFPFLQQLLAGGSGGGAGPAMPPDAIPSPEMAQPLPPPQARPTPMAPSLGDLLGAGGAGAAYQPPGQTAASMGGNAAAIPVPPPKPPGAQEGTYGPEQAPGSPLASGSGGTIPLPTPRPAAAGPGAPAAGPPRAAASLPGALQQALQGVRAMQPPAPQTVRTPAAPHIQPVGQAQIINLLSSLGIGPSQAAGMGLFRR